MGGGSVVVNVQVEVSTAFTDEVSLHRQLLVETEKVTVMKQYQCLNIFFV